MTSFVLLVEYSGVKHRSWAGTNIYYYSSVCFMFLSLLAYLIRDWRYLMLYGACVSVPVVISSWYEYNFMDNAIQSYYMAQNHACMFFGNIYIKTKYFLSS